MSFNTENQYTQMGAVVVALNKIEELQQEVLGEVIGGSEKGIAECIENFTDEDYERAYRIGLSIKRSEVEGND